MLNINKQAEEGRLCIFLEGRLDTITSPELEAELTESLEGVSELVLDLEQLDYISSAGLRVLLSAQKKMNKQGTLKVLHVNDTVKEIFNVTGFTDILNIE